MRLILSAAAAAAAAAAVSPDRCFAGETQPYEHTDMCIHCCDSKVCCSALATSRAQMKRTHRVLNQHQPSLHMHVL